jgi:mono/diheme cytochrome c family protein
MRWPRRVALHLCLGLVAATWALAAAAGAPAADSDSAAAAPAAGYVLYVRTCAGCHGLEGVGNGPDADLWAARPADLRRSDVLKRYTDAELAAFIRDGARLRLTARPEAFAQHQAQADVLYEFLGRLPNVPWDRVDAGEAVYIERCLACHDRFGRPQATLPPGVRAAPRDLSDAAFRSSTDEATLTELVRHGRQSMPALVPRITEREAWELAGYVRLLSPGYTLYASYCMTCHGPHGEGAVGLAAEASAPRLAFDAAYFEGRSPEKVRKAVWHMLREAKPTMPHFSTVLTASEAEAILAYLRSLPPLPAAPAPRANGK